MTKKLLTLWSFLLCFALGVSAEEVTIDFSKKGFANAELLKTVEQDGITVTFNKGNSSTDPAYYNTGTAARVYAGGSMTVSSTNEIQSIVFTFGSGDGKNAITADCGTFATNTWTGASTSVKFSVGGTSKHRRIKSLTITTASAAPTVAKPAFTPAPGDYIGAQNVAIECATEGAKIYYTLDGAEPSATSTEYTAPIAIAQTTTVKAIAISGEDKSSVATANYNILKSIANTADAPMTVAEALAAIKDNDEATLAHADNKVYVKGIINYIQEVSAQYGNATYSIVTAQGDADTLLIFRGKYLDGAKFTEETAPEMAVGKQVVIYGNLVYYNGTTPEMAANNYLVSIEDVPAVTEVANIGALKDVPEGTEVKLALTNAVVNLWSGSGQSMASYVEDATGAIKFDMGLSNIEWMRDSIAMNGYVYASYGKDYDGIPQLSVSDSTIASKVDTVAAVPTSKVMTVADASAESAISRYVKFEKVEFAKKVIDDWGTTECYLVQGTDTITFFDKFSLFGWGAMPDFKSFDEVQGFISVYEGKFEFYPYGEYKATYTPAVVVENIAAAKAVESGTNVNLTLKDAKITAYLPSKHGGSATAFIEDASGAIQISGDVLSAVGVESNNMILNGNMYVKYVNEWGTIQLSSGDSLAYSKVEAKEGVVEATTMAVKDIKAEANVARYIEIASPSFKYDEENYCYVAIQEGDTIIVVDNFGWMSQNFEMDDEYNLILPDSVTSIKGIVMWDDWNGYSISPLSIEEFVAPQDIVVNVTEGDIAAAVETAKAAVKKVGKITINLTEGVAYTVNSSIVAPAALVINGNGATIDASALNAPFIALSKEPTAELINNYYRVDSVMISNVRVDSIKNSIFYDNGTQYCVVDFTIDNSVLNLATTSVQNDALVSFKLGGAKDFNIKNSTVYGNGVAKYFIRYNNNNGRIDRYGFTDASDLWSMTYTNNTFYKVNQSRGQWGNYNGVAGKATLMVMTIKDNIWADCSSEIMRRLNQAKYFSNFHASSQMQNNTFWYSEAGSVESQGSYGNDTDLTTNPGFKDAATGNFTIYAGSDQAKEQTGDPRWLVEFDELLTGINGVNANAAVISGDIYTINGVKVRNAGDSLNGLAKGLYIVNGKKFIVK